MKIYETYDKRKYMPLLLLADEQKSMVERYIVGGKMFVLDDNGIKAEIIVLEVSDNVLEIKNLAVLPEFQRKGYGRKLIEYICRQYKNKYSILQVGTGDSPLTLPFYEKCGFKKSHTVKNFFIENYDHPIIENGKQLIDMVYLIKKIN